MKRPRIKIFIVLMLALACAGCSKRHITGIELALNQQDVTLPAASDKTDPQYFYVSIFSNTAWTCGFEEDTPWCLPEANSGKGTSYVKVNYEKNTTGEARTAVFTVRTLSKECRLTITQP